jgi:hypothetical protein
LLAILSRVRQKEDRYRRLTARMIPPRQLAADAWCATFVWGSEKAIEALTGHIPAAAENPDAVSASVRGEIGGGTAVPVSSLACAFSDVFRVRWQWARRRTTCGGLAWRFRRRAGLAAVGPSSCREKWFGAAQILGTERNGTPKVIAALATEDPALYAAWLDDSRKAEGESHLVRNTGHSLWRSDANTTRSAETNH